MRRWAIIGVMALATGQSGCCIVEEAIGKAVEQSLALMVCVWKDAAPLRVSAAAFRMAEGRWPETREELELGAAMIGPEMPELDYDLRRFEAIETEEDLDGTLLIRWRRVRVNGTVVEFHIVIEAEEWMEGWNGGSSE